MKKITLSLVAAGLATASLGAYAATPTSAAPFQVTVPNLQSGMNFTLEGLYVQPTNSDLTYASSTTASGNTTNTNVVTPDYGLGFRVGLGYVFPSSGNDMQLAWTHFDQDTTDTLTQNLTGNVTDGISSTASFKYNAADLDMGQYLSMGTRLQSRLFAGLRYANLENDVTNVNAITTANVVGSDITTATFNSKFEGFGPRFGVETTYHVNNCLGVVAHFATSLLVGRTESSSVNQNVVTTANSSTTSIANYNPANQTRVVPAFDGKLGLDYTFGFNKDTSNMTIEAGYQVTQYLDAIDRANGSSATTSSVGFNGPYLGLNFKM